MSIQQVNLYLPELRPKKEWLTANTLIACIGVYIVILFLTQFVVRGHISQLESEAQIIENQKVASEKRLTRFASMRKSGDSVQLDANINRLKHEVFSRQQIGQFIQGKKLGNEVGFSSNMETLARQSLDSISLSRFRLSRGGEFIEMQGATKTPGDIPLFIEKLQTENSFRQVQFGAISVGSATLKSSSHEFSLGFTSVYEVAADRINTKSQQKTQ